MRAEQEIAIPYLQAKAHVINYDNGYTFVFVPKKGDVFNVSTWVKTGSLHEDDENNGVSHFLEHLMFKGTERFKPGEFDRAMEGMGAVINAATWKDFTYYYVTGPKGGDESNFAKALDMHADMLLHSTLPDEEIGPQYNPEDPDYKGEKRERSVVIEEIGMREDQPWTKIYNAVNHMMYPDGHPYQRDVIGSRQIIGNIPRQSIVSYYETWYSPANLITIVVGDFELGSLEKDVLRAFSFTRSTPAANGKHKSNGKQGTGTRFKEVKGDYQTTFFIVGFHGPETQNYQESIALDVASYILGEGRSSRLTQSLIERPAKPIFTMASTGQSTFKLGNVFFIQGNFTAPDYKKPMKQLWDEIEKFLSSEPVTQEELNRALKKMKVDFAETSETASGIAEAIGESMTVVGDLGFYTEYLNVLNNLDVATVNEVARKYLSQDKAYTSVLVPENA